jgi:hypothetical protein
MRSHNASLTTGLLFVLFGAWLILRQIDRFPAVSERLLPLFLIGVSIVLLADAVKRSGTTSLFWSVFILQIGIFFLLRNYRVIPRIDADEYWPVFLFAFGLSFYLLFLIHPKSWGLLFPAGLFLYTGLETASNTLLNAPAGLEWACRIFIPLFLVFSGSWMLIRSRLEPGDSKDRTAI